MGEIRFCIFIRIKVGRKGQEMEVEKSIILEESNF